MQDANVKAAQEVNERRKKWEQKLQDEAEKVSFDSDVLTGVYSYGKKEKESKECRREMLSSSKKSTNSTTITKMLW